MNGFKGDARVLDITSKRNQHEDPKARMSNQYKDLCKMFMKLAQDVEKCLKIRVDPELDKSCTTEGHLDLVLTVA
jgi:hypothetical protein